MATIFHRLIFMVLLSALSVGAPACRRNPEPDPPTTTGLRGGELVASVRSEPKTYNRYFDATAPGDLLALLTHARLVRINRVTDTLEPGLAERWEPSADGATVTLHLRRDVTFSDGTPFSAADVLFSFAVAYESPASTLAEPLKVAGQPLAVSAPDPQTVVVRFPTAFAPGVRILDNLPILPRHKLERAFRDGNIERAWTPATPLAEIVGLGPFVFAQHVPGERMIFRRNPRYWRRTAEGTPLPYLDELRVEIIPDQNAEALRLESGATDLMSNADIRPDDYVRFKNLAAQGRLELLDGGVAIDPNILWFNLPSAGRADPKPWLRRREFRQALSFGADRQALANTVYFGAAVPISGPVTPGNATWFSSATPFHGFDAARARQLLAGAGLTDRNGDGALEDAAGRPVRFSMLVQAGHTIRERTATVLQEQFRRLGVGVDIVSLDTLSLYSRWQARDYESIYHGFQASSTDPAMSLDFWLSSGLYHFWNPGQVKPATEWEAAIDDLMRKQVAAASLAERQRLFVDVQRLFAEHVPALYFAAPKVTIAVSPRVTNVSPAPLIPQLLWSADTLAVTGPRRSR